MVAESLSACHPPVIELFIGVGQLEIQVGRVIFFSEIGHSNNHLLVEHIFNPYLFDRLHTVIANFRDYGFPCPDRNETPSQRQPY